MVESQHSFFVLDKESKGDKARKKMGSNQLGFSSLIVSLSRAMSYTSNKEARGVMERGYSGSLSSFEGQEKIGLGLGENSNTTIAFSFGLYIK